jgi:hypothetical protein
MKNKSLIKKSIIITLIALFCLVSITVLCLPSKIGNIVFGRDANHEVIAVQVRESSTTSAPIYTYYTDSKADIESFNGQILQLSLSPSHFAINARRVIEYSSVLYDVTFYKSDKKTVQLTISADGKVYTNHVVYSVLEPQRIKTAMSLAKYWRK